MVTQRTRWLQVLKPISPRANLIIGCLSFVVPILIWSLVSYVPWIWHPQVFITNPGSIDYLQAGMRMDKEAFADAVAEAKDEKREPPQGVPANPIYLPAPHEVATALYTSFTTPPATQDGNWLHQSLWHSIQVIFWGFVISSISCPTASMSSGALTRQVGLVPVRHIGHEGLALVLHSLGQLGYPRRHVNDLLGEDVGRAVVNHVAVFI